MCLKQDLKIREYTLKMYTEWNEFSVERSGAINAFLYPYLGPIPSLWRSCEGGGGSEGPIGWRQTLWERRRLNRDE